MRMRTSHSKRIISVIVALSMVLSMLSGLSFTANAAEAVSVSTWSELKAALESTADMNITVAGNIDFSASDATTAQSNCISITAGTKTLDLNGKGVSFMVDTFELMEVSSGSPKSVISISGSASLAISDSVGNGILEYIAYGSEYFAFTSPKQSGGLISMSGTSKLSVTKTTLNNVAVGPCINMTSGSPTVDLNGATLTTGSSLYSWSGGFALLVSENTTSPSVTLSNSAKLLCSSVNAIYSSYSSGGGAMYVGNYNASITINSAILVGTVQSRVSGSGATKLPYVSVSTHTIKVDKTVHTADADYLLGPTNYDISADASGSGSGYYFMVIADENDNSQTITTEIVLSSIAEEESNTFDTVIGAFEGAYGTTDKNFSYGFATDAAGTNLINATSYFRDKITPAVGSDASSITVTSDIAAKMTGFAQFYTDTRWTCASELSFDLKMGSEGNDFAGFYVKYGSEIVSGASKNAVFYSNDGVRGDSANSTTGTTGIGFSFRTIENTPCIEIFVKYLDASGNLCVAGQYYYDVVSDLSAFNTYRVTDDGAGTVKFYANDVLFATVVCSDAKVPTASSLYTETYYSTAKLYDKNGALASTISNALVSTESAFAFGTRNETIEIDNIVAQDKTFADPKISGRMLSIANDITIKYVVYKSDLTSVGFSNPTLKTYFEDEEKIITPIETSVGGVASYVFAFENIAPQMMGDLIYTTLYADYNGGVYASVPMEYSVETYAYNILKSSTNAELQTLLVDMLNYGSFSQLYKGYKETDLVNESLTTEQAAWGTQELRTLTNSASAPTFEEEEDIPPVTWSGISLNLDDKIGIRGLITTTESIEGMYVKVTNEYGDVLGTISSDQFVASTSAANTYIFLYEKITMNQLSTIVYITVYNSIDQVVSGTYVYSVESYVAKYYDSVSGYVKEILVAMMKYGDSALAYSS